VDKKQEKEVVQFRKPKGSLSHMYVVAVLFFFSEGIAQDAEKRVLRAGGLLFGDMYYIPTHHLEDGQGAMGAVLRRGYLTFDTEFGKRWFGRLRFELNQSGEFETYDFEIDFKDLYLGLKAGRQKITFGLSPPPTFDLIESHWGLRYLVRTPMDLQGVASRDFGIAAKGPINKAETFVYRAMVGSGINFGTESDDGWHWAGALSWKPAPEWVFDVYLDYERLPGPGDRATFQLFTGYKTERLRWGLQYSNQDRQDDPRLQLASGYIIGQVIGKSSLIGRIDRIIEPSPKGNNISYIPFDPDSKATSFNAGWEFPLTNYLLLTPNVIFIHYDENDSGTRPENDLHLRLTLFLDLESTIGLF
jgi:hypothetical protein